MADFPSIRTSDWELFKERPRKRQVRTTFEAGYIHSRAAATLTKKIFSIGWKWLLRTEYNTLVTFFSANQGGTFNFTHPITSVVYVVGFAEDELPDIDSIGTDYIALGGLKLEEQ